MLLFIVIFSVVVAVGFGLASAWSDFKGFTISNIYAAGVIAAFIPAFLVMTFLAPEVVYFASWKSHLMAAAIMFAVTFVLFSFNVIGAGDSKLCTAYALWAGLLGLPAFLFYMTLCGGLLGVVTLILRKWKPFKNPPEQGWLAQAQAGSKEVPYGIAIVIGAIVTFVINDYFDPDALTALARSAQGEAGL